MQFNRCHHAIRCVVIVILPLIQFHVGFGLQPSATRAMWPFCSLLVASPFGPNRRPLALRQPSCDSYCGCCNPAFLRCRRTLGLGFFGHALRTATSNLGHHAIQCVVIVILHLIQFYVILDAMRFMHATINLGNLDVGEHLAIMQFSVWLS